MSDNRTFIVLDGPDFSGKSTLMEAFLSRLSDSGQAFVALREPGDEVGKPSLAEDIRKALLSERVETVHPETDILLHTGYRMQNVKNIIIPGLEAGKWVISDRFIFSTWCLNVQAHIDTHPHLVDLMYGLMQSRGFASDNKLVEAIVLNEANGFEVAADLYNTVVLEPAGITLDQLKKQEKLEGQFLPAALLVAGEQVSDRFASNPELHEVSLSIPMGGSRTANVVFGRGQSTVMQIHTKTESAEMKRVLTHIDGLFADVSS